MEVAVNLRDVKPHFEFLWMYNGSLKLCGTPSLRSLFLIENVFIKPRYHDLLAARVVQLVRRPR